MNSFYLASMDVIHIIPPRRCTLLEKVFWSKIEKVIRVGIDIPLPPRPLFQEQPIKELLLSFCNPSQSMSDIGREPVMVDILIPVPKEQLFHEAPIRIAIGTLHTNLEEAINFSPIEKTERAWFAIKRSPEMFTAVEITFIGEQVGAIEDSLKERFCDIFTRASSVRRAYLVRVSYGSAPDISVALCVNNSTGPDEELQKQLGQVFASIFKQDEHLDIVFLENDKEDDLRKVCPPFYPEGGTV